MNSIVTLNPRLTLSPRRATGYLGLARDRAYRRALRAAELAAWEAADRRPRTTTPTGSQAQTQRQNGQEDRAERLLFLLLFVTVAAGLLLSAQGTSDWPSTVDRLSTWILPLLQ